MKAQLMRTLALVFILALGMVLAARLMQAQEPPADEEAAAQEDVSAAITVAQTISVQGRLTDASGSPINGDYIIDARLYDSSNFLRCSYSTSVDVNNGYFATAIYNCSNEDLNGQQLYLEIQVVGETLLPREPVRIVPYAATLRPGARIGGSGAGDGDLYLYDASNRRTIRLDAGAGVLRLGDSGKDGDLDLRNSSSTSTFWVDGDTGNVGQTRTGYGLVKAAVYAKCASIGSTIYRSFPSLVSIADGGYSGRCKLTFGFPVNDRFYAATAHGADAANARMVNCA